MKKGWRRRLKNFLLLDLSFSIRGGSHELQGLSHLLVVLYACSCLFLVVIHVGHQIPNFVP